MLDRGEALSIILKIQNEGARTHAILEFAYLLGPYGVTNEGDYFALVVAGALTKAECPLFLSTVKPTIGTRMTRYRDLVTSLIRNRALSPLS